MAVEELDNLRLKVSHQVLAHALQLRTVLFFANGARHFGVLGLPVYRRHVVHVKLALLRANPVERLLH